MDALLVLGALASSIRLSLASRPAWATATPDWPEPQVGAALTLEEVAAEAPDR